jgi:hypothetical protein
VETAVPENIETYLGLYAVYEQAHRHCRYKIEDEEQAVQNKPSDKSPIHGHASMGSMPRRL